MSASGTASEQRSLSVCWLSSARYSQPLDKTSARKWQLLAGLPGYDIRVIGFAESLRPRRFREQVSFWLLPQAPVSLLRHVTYFALAPWLLGMLALRGKADIIVAQSPFEGAVGAFVKRLPTPGRKQRLIVENHNHFEVDLFLQRRVPLPGLYRALMLACARCAFRHADALRVISSSTAERARHFAPGLPQARFMTFSDTDIFAETPRRIPVQDALDIVFAGVLTPGKGVHHLLNAFAALDHPGARLRLVGEAKNANYAAQLRAQAADLGIAERVDFVGALSQRELARHFASARVMVLPSLSEGLGRVVVEAMLLGMPVIGSRVGGIPDLIQDGVTGLLVEPGDEDDLLRALRDIYARDVSAMGSRARAFAQDFFSPQAYAASYQELFALALGRQRESGESAAQ